MKQLLLIVIIVAGILGACNQPYNVSKKRGFYRIDFPTKAYQSFNQPGYPYQFEYPVYARVVKDSTFYDDQSVYWMCNCDEPSLNGRIYISYKAIGP